MRSSHHILTSTPQALLNNRITITEQLIVLYLLLIAIKLNVIGYWIGEDSLFKLLVVYLNFTLSSSFATHILHVFINTN